MEILVVDQCFGDHEMSMRRTPEIIGKLGLRNLRSVFRGLRGKLGVRRLTENGVRVFLATSACVSFLISWSPRGHVQVDLHFAGYSITGAENHHSPAVSGCV